MVSRFIVEKRKYKKETSLTRRVQLVEEELLTFQEHLSSFSVF